MIIFYNKKTKEIVGIVNGRVHSEDVLKMTMTMSDIGETKKYVVPFKTKYETVLEDVEELRVVDKETMKVDKVVIGKKEVKKSIGMFPDVEFSNLITDFEDNKKNINDYKIIEKDNVVVNIVKK